MFEQFDSARSVLTIPDAVVTGKGIKIPPDVAAKIEKKDDAARGNSGNGNGNKNGKKVDNIFNDGRRRLAQIGTETVLVVRVVAGNGQTTANRTTLSDSVFGTSGDPVNLKSQYSSCSHGKFTFVEADGRSGKEGSFIADGVTEVTIATDTSAGDIVMRNAISDELNRLFSVSTPTALADHLMVSTSMSLLLLDIQEMKETQDYCLHF